MRILVTGSRDWKDAACIRFALAELLDPLPDEEGFIVVHGDCPTGADAIASRWTTSMISPGDDNTVFEEKYPADWKTHGRAAGPIRNKQMVDSKPDICLAFIGPGSKGAVGCAKMAEEAGIPTKRFYDDY